MQDCSFFVYNKQRRHAFPIDPRTNPNKQKAPRPKKKTNHNNMLKLNHAKRKATRRSLDCDKSYVNRLEAVRQAQAITIRFAIGWNTNITTSSCNRYANALSLQINSIQRNRGTFAQLVFITQSQRPSVIQR